MYEGWSLPAPEDESVFAESRGGPLSCEPCRGRPSGCQGGLQGDGARAALLRVLAPLERGVDGWA